MGDNNGALRSTSPLRGRTAKWECNSLSSKMVGYRMGRMGDVRKGVGGG